MYYNGNLQPDQVIARALAESVLLVGDPGIGKTVALHHLARQARGLGVNVVFRSVGSTAATSLGGLRNELGLDYELIDILAEWTPGTGKLLIIDSLDAARSEPQADLWRRLIDLASSRLPDWPVVAAVRTWDLRHSPRLQAQFPGPSSTLGDLLDDELLQLAAAWPELATLIHSAPEHVRRLLRNPFNLRLAADLFLAGTSPKELSGVRSQLELLDRYWAHRMAEGGGGLARQALVARGCEAALHNRALTVGIADLLRGDASSGDVSEALLPRSVLAEASALPGLPSVPAVRFAHHVLFDYAVATTFAAGGEEFAERLHADPDLVLFARPSVDMHLERLWGAGPGEFWDTAVRIASDEGLPRLATVALAEVAARGPRRSRILSHC